ncbi:MAG: prephenate dehydratase [Bacteroidales bacterium]|nr:prephenate dehydratase [Bacteroidales bacterium]
MKKIAIQGVKGAFHQVAAEHYYAEEEIEIIECLSFNDLFEVVENGQADHAIMAVENTIGGSILPNYKLLRFSNLKIAGEIYLKISQHLLALPGVSIMDIREVYSHPMAILQTEKFFRQYPHIKLINAIDTALSAKEIADNQSKITGAIAGERAVELYGLDILAKDIETINLNQTRFLILKPNNSVFTSSNEVNKASISFVLTHKKGSLSQILSILAFYDMNLTKIQSLPIQGEEWEYEFFVDLCFDTSEKYFQAINAIKPLLINLAILGEYRQGKRILNA